MSKSRRRSAKNLHVLEGIESVIPESDLYEIIDEPDLEDLEDLEDVEEPKELAASELPSNRFWARRNRYKFKSPEELRARAEEYFEWVDANPLYEMRVAQYKGVAVYMKVQKMRAMTITGFCIFVGTGQDVWRKFKTREGYEETVQYICDVIFTQKFEGAAADLLNANVVIRDLGLKDRSDLTSGDEAITAITRTVIK